MAAVNLIPSPLDPYNVRVVAWRDRDHPLSLCLSVCAGVQTPEYKYEKRDWKKEGKGWNDWKKDDWKKRPGMREMRTRKMGKDWNDWKRYDFLLANITEQISHQRQWAYSRLAPCSVLPS